jgi:thiol-disulfide isomerase/thioredoxin
MKKYKSLFIITCILVTNYTANGQDLLRLAQEEIDRHERVSYKQTAFYPNPVGRIDTVNVTANFQKSKSSLVEYDFIIQKHSFNSDVIHIDGRFRSVRHKDETVVLYPENDHAELIHMIEILPDFEYSPITLLNRSGWEFVRDTLIGGQELKEYLRVVTDEIRNGNTIYSEQHIFLNPDSKLLEKWERHNFYNGTLQKVVYTYSDYNLTSSGDPLSYEFPSGYRSELYGKTNRSKILEAGQQAPVFSGSNLQGSSIDLEDYRGKKVLLNFSSIGCPHSQDALRYMDEEGFQLAGSIMPLFLSIWDRKEDVVEYFKQINASLTVILDAEEISEMYGVSGTPTFFLIDENGNIEKVTDGFDKEFLNSLKAGS